MYSGEDVIKLLRTELPRLSGNFSFSYTYRLPMTDHPISGVGEGHEDAELLLKHLQRYTPKSMDFQLTLF